MLRRLAERLGGRKDSAVPGVGKLFSRVLDRFAPPERCEYPNGSHRGYGNPSDDDASPWLRIRRWRCASKNHHPRLMEDAWSAVFGFKCARCGLWGDPATREQIQAWCDAVNSGEDERHASYAIHGRRFGGGR